LGKKHVSRRRLCLPGMMEFRVNAVSGQPFFFITAQINGMNRFSRRLKQKHPWEKAR
jgi:hypothetical protein